MRVEDTLLFSSFSFFPFFVSFYDLSFVCTSAKRRICLNPRDSARGTYRSIAGYLIYVQKQTRVRKIFFNGIFLFLSLPVRPLALHRQRQRDGEYLAAKSRGYVPKRGKEAMT
jgi:hypothetical protein